MARRQTEVMLRREASFLCPVTEATYILQAAGWDDDPHSIAEQRTVTDGRIVPVGKGFVRKPPKRVDYLLRYTRDFSLAVVEAKADYKAAADGLQ
jgi:type I restriction enzyme R subunit